MQDVISERGYLFLGSRLKRLAERMQGDVVSVATQAGLDVQPAQYPLLATLDRDGAMSVGDLARSLGLSQPTVTRNVARLAETGLVTVSRAGRDQRHKTVTLTPAGNDALARSKLAVWPGIEAAVRDMLDGLDGPLLTQVAALERMLAERPLADRARDVSPRLVVRDFSDALAPHFRTINAQWIEAMYRLEPTDEAVLDHPRERIVDPGGAILFAEAEGLIVGTCALQKTGDRQFELTKMGVLEAARGLKVGQFLLAAAIARAAAMGAERLYLLTNRKSQAAIHLYEKLGFVHDADVMREFGARYARCYVAMLYRPAAA